MAHIFDNAIQMLTHGMDLSLKRQQVLSSNIANLDTPNFAPQDVDFDAALREAIAAKSTGGVARVPTVSRADKSPGLNGNSVDLDVQMSRVAHNALYYSALTQATTRKLSMLRFAITESGS